ncbi:MAG: transcriptional regulator with XRE-family HTH domain [Oleispira sp.]|jgi:transcriptional regulator with XRE-family HTH domain
MNNPGLIDIGLKLKEIRKQRGLTQQQAAFKASILRQDVSKIESGSFVGAISTLNKYLQFAGLQLTSQALPSQFVQLDDLKSVFNDE